MAKPVNSPSSGDIWHLSIDDLLEPLPPSDRLGGPGPFVINLSASTAPIGQPLNHMASWEPAHVYQLVRTEDRRVRYRLRLGPFVTEDEAIAVLLRVRDSYPGALTATADADDLRAIAALDAKNDARAARRPAAASSPPMSTPSLIPVLTNPVEKAVAAPTQTLTMVPAPMSVRPVTVSAPPVVVSAPPVVVSAPPVMVSAPPPAATPPLLAVPPPRPNPQPKAITPPAVVAPVVVPPVVAPVAVRPAAVAPVAVPPVVIAPVAVAPVAAPRVAAAPIAAPPSVAVEIPLPPVVAAPVIAPPPVAVRPVPAMERRPPMRMPPRTVVLPKQPPASAPVLKAPVAPAPTVVRAAPASIAPPPIAAPPIAPLHIEQLPTQLSDIESTLTLRPLTSLEFESAGAPHWYVIQLSVCDDAFDPDTLPNLDIFNVYRLYSVAGIDQGRIMHALRLGFFGEERAASAVSAYLAAYYEKPVVKRVSKAERDRFSDHSLEARKDIGATGRHAVIEITDERVVRDRSKTAAIRPAVALKGR
jgi:hypothetical protein